MGHLLDQHRLPEAHGVATYQDLPSFGLLQHAAAQIPNSPAVVYGGQQWTYQGLNTDAVRAAAMLQRLGVRPGDRVGLLLPNVPEYIVAVNGIWRAGAIAVAISPLMVAEEVQSILGKTECTHVICLDMLSHLLGCRGDSIVTTLLVSIRQHLPAVQQLGYLWMRRNRTGQWTLPSTDRNRWFWQEIEQTDQRWRPISIQPAIDPAYILPTGGTTGSPKAVTLSHTNMVANAWQQYQWTGGSFGAETMMAVLPFFHSYGMSTTVMGGAAMGAKLIMNHRFNTRQVIRLMERNRPTVFHAVPAMLVAMNERFRSRPPRFEGLQWVISGGAPLDESIASEFAEHTGALVVEGYGLSEASPVTHVGPLFEEPHYGTIGLPLPQTRCRIVAQDESGIREVDDGEVGELIVSGPQVMLGYWNDRLASEQTVREGWLHTGDLAFMNASGFYQIAGRKKDLIITSGFNVYPSEVEDALREALNVADVAVVAAPDAARGEIVKAFVVLQPGAEWDESSLRAHCRKHLSKHKQPRAFERWHGDLPRNFLGKVIRRELRELSQPTTQSDALEG